MKKTLLFVAVALCAFITVSCKNNRAAKEAEQAKVTEEIVEAAKVVLTEEAKTILDDFGKKYLKLSENGEYTNFSTLLHLNLTEQEKLNKPEYLFNPANINNLLTKLQKLNALAIILAEYSVRESYDMPLDESNEAIAKLSAEINFPLDILEELKSGISPYEIASKHLEKSKENGTEDMFWTFAYTLQNTALYLISNNPDLYLKDLSEEKYQQIKGRSSLVLGAMKTLAPFNTDINNIVKLWDSTDGKYVTDPKEFSDLNGFKNVLKINKDLYALARAESLNK